MPPLLATAIAFASLICGALGFLAVSERELTTGGRVGIHHSSGLTAVIAGWLFVAGALALLGMFANASRFKRLIWVMLAVVWSASVTVYFVWFY